jgi:rubrerythrin
MSGYQMQLFSFNRKRFSDLSEAEILALAISSEEDDARIYSDYADRCRQDFPATADMFVAMANEEHEHRRKLINDFQRRFGEHIPLIRREHVAGYFSRRPVWLVENLGVDRMRKEARNMELDAYHFYMTSAQNTSDAETRKLLGDLAAQERGHVCMTNMAEKKLVSDTDKQEENQASQRQFLLTWVQPGLAGLMDGSVSTLAPIFATAFATHNTHTTLLIGLAAATGAGISMGFTEATHDDGVLSGRGSPIKRGISCGVMTTIGGLGHALPYLIPDFWTATGIAFAVVLLELCAIVWIQHRFMETPIARAVFQIILGGTLVLLAGILIGGG